MMPDGFRKFLVHNVKELEILMMHNRHYAAEIASAVSAKNRKAIVARAQELNIKLTNGKAKVKSEEQS